VLGCIITTKKRLKEGKWGVLCLAYCGKSWAGWHKCLRIAYAHLVYHKGTKLDKVLTIIEQNMGQLGGSISRALASVNNYYNYDKNDEN
jgi:hypothetical protein